MVAGTERREVYVFRGQIPKDVMMYLILGPLATVADEHVRYGDGEGYGEVGWDYFDQTAFAKLRELNMIKGSYSGEYFLMVGRVGYQLDQVKL